MGKPKALFDDWLVRGIDVLTAAGCTPVVVVLGAAAAQGRALLRGRSVIIATAADWSAGLSASLRAGIAALPWSAPAVVVSLVDLPDVGETVVRRVLEQGAAPATANPQAPQPLSESDLSQPYQSTIPADQYTQRSEQPPPFWAFAWAGGQALARYLLDQPQTVAGRRVLDLACGSGLVAGRRGQGGVRTDLLDLGGHHDRECFDGRLVGRQRGA